MVVSATALAIVPAAVADDLSTATAVLQAQLQMLKQQKILNKCLAASPTKNTPCITRNSLKLARLTNRHMKVIQAAIDGTERACVRKVARQELSYLQIWRDGARALNRNERKKARRLFLSSLDIGNAQAEIQPQCFAEVFAAGP